MLKIPSILSLKIPTFPPFPSYFSKTSNFLKKIPSILDNRILDNFLPCSKHRAAPLDVKFIRHTQQPDQIAIRFYAHPSHSTLHLLYSMGRSTGHYILRSCFASTPHQSCLTVRSTHSHLGGGTSKA